MLSAAAYLLIFLLHLSASTTCDAASQNRRLLLLFAGSADDATTSLSPAAIHHRHHPHHTAKVTQMHIDDRMQVLSDYHDVRYHPAMMAPRGGPTPQPSPSSVEVAGVVGGAPQPPVSFPVEAGKRDTGAARMEPSPMPAPRGEGASSEASATESASDDVSVDYAGPRTHPHDPPAGPAKSID